MRILFLHRNFPAQFRHLVRLLAADRRYEVAFTTAHDGPAPPGVRKLVYPLPKAPAEGEHRYLRFAAEAVAHGQGAANAALALKRLGFVPEVIVGHTWGPTLFMKDIFPDVPLLGYFEWYYNLRGSDIDFDPTVALTADFAAYTRAKNAHILLDLAHCDAGITPTRWQQAQFPELFRPRLTVLHDGIDTDYFRPAPGTHLRLPGLDLAGEIVTYVARGLEPYRGFPQFIAALPRLLKERPRCQVVIVGADRVFYGSERRDGRSWQEAMLAEHPLDRSRVHFVGRLPYALYRNVLQASAVHVYLTYPFVLSWSLLEAMAAGCPVVASDTPPVREVIVDGVNGHLVDFFDPEGLAGRIAAALDDPQRTRLRQAARATVCAHYALRDLLPRQLALLRALAEGGASAPQHAGAAAPTSLGP